MAIEQINEIRDRLDLISIGLTRAELEVSRG